MAYRVVILSKLPLFCEGIKCAFDKVDCKFVVIGNADQFNALDNRLDLVIVDESNKQYLDVVTSASVAVLSIRNPDFKNVSNLELVNAGLTYKDSLDEIKCAALTCIEGEKYFSNSFLDLFETVKEKAEYPNLTRRQSQVLCYLLDGMLNKQIAHKLDLCEHTVKSHVSNIYRKFNVGSRIELINSFD